MIISTAHISAILAFSFWGLFPLYWKLFTEVTAWDLFAHRLSWSFVTLILFLAFKRRLKGLTTIWKDSRTRWMLVLSAIFISSNWLLYIYAVNVGKVLEASMGYFLNPLINVFMGWLILKEKIRTTQWPAIILAVIAMVLIGLQTNLQNIPWIALILSVTFALYGLLRKLAKVGSLEGLTFETCAMILPVLGVWYFQSTTPLTAIETLSWWKVGALSLSGVVTCLPLVLFAFSAKRLTLGTLGFIQYLSPSLKFICGYYFLGEYLSVEKLQAFLLIWMALIWYSLESYYFSKRPRKVPVITE